MKETLYTIPVNDAFDQKGECPFCNMKKQLETDSIDYMLGPSYMEDDIRMETDKIGFCQKHYSMMYNQQNRLGLALMMQSHIKKVLSDIDNLSADLKNTEKKGLFSKPKIQNKVTPYIDNITHSCYICDRINKNFDRYFDTFFYMWKKDSDIKEKVKTSNGFCLEHFSKLIETAEKTLTSKQFNEFIEIIVPLQKDNINRLLDELELFINKFDHNYANTPWGTAKDSLIRAILKTASENVED